MPMTRSDPFTLHCSSGSCHHSATAAVCRVELNDLAALSLGQARGMDDDHGPQTDSHADALGGVVPRCDPPDLPIRESHEGAIRQHEDVLIRHGDNGHWGMAYHHSASTAEP